MDEGYGLMDGPLAAFMALVLGDDALQAQLGEFEDAEDYLAAARAIAAARGAAFDEAAARAALRPYPPGMGRFMPSPVTLDRWPSSGWLPARSVDTGGAPLIDWIRFGAHRLQEPFYEDSVRRFEARPFNRMFRTRTTLAAVTAGASGRGRAPDGLVYHMSRCGSTLVAQLLGVDPRHIVLSEPEPLDGVIRWALESGAPLADQVAAVHGIVAALGRTQSGAGAGEAGAGEAGAGGRLFVKLDSWHAAALPLLRAAFPTTPWTYLYRDPIEVLVSQMRQRGMQTVPGMLPLSIVAIPGAEGLDPDRYAALALAHGIEAMLRCWDVGGGVAVDYAELPDAVATRIMPHFGLVPDAAQRAALAAAAARDAKNPHQQFSSDSEQKRRDANPEIVASAAEILAPLHQRLSRLHHETKHFPRPH